jgi:hypothetical protein
VNGSGNRAQVVREGVGGFSLLELVLALVLLHVGILGAVSVIHLAQRNIQRAEITFRSVVEGNWVAGAVAGTQGTGVRTEDWGELSWGPAAMPVPSLRIIAWSPALKDTLVDFLALPRLEGPEILAPGTVASLGSW